VNLQIREQRAAPADVDPNLLALHVHGSAPDGYESVPPRDISAKVSIRHNDIQCTENRPWRQRANARAIRWRIGVFNGHWFPPAPARPKGVPHPEILPESFFSRSFRCAPKAALGAPGAALGRRWGAIPTMCAQS
jgi:hypothetical protein